MSLSKLQATFEAQVAADGYITVSKAVLENDANLTCDADFDQVVQNNLLLSAALTVTTSTIPPVDGNTLTVTGTADIVNLTAVPVTLTFTIDANGITQLLLQGDLANEWILTDSFPFLTGYPVSNLHFTTPAYLLTTQTVASYTWQTRETLRLEKGLNFSGYLLLDNTFAGINAFIPSFEVNSTTLFSGPMNPTQMAVGDAIYPLMRLVGTLPGTVSVPPFTVQDPNVSFSITESSDPSAAEATVKTNIWLCFDVNLVIGEGDSASIWPFSAPILNGSPSYNFGLAQNDQATVSVQDIIALIDSDFTEVIPPVISDLFSAITLVGFSASFNTHNESISAPENISITIGTPPDANWKIGEFTIEKIALCYTLLYPFTSRVIVRNYFSAIFQFYAGPPEEDALFPGYFEVNMMNQGENGFKISANYDDQTAGLAKIIEVMSGPAAFQVPSQLDSVTFSDFGVSFITAGNQGGDAYRFYGNAQVVFPISFLGTELIFDFQVDVSWTPGEKTTYMANGGLTLGNAYFSVIFNCADNNTLLTANWAALNEAYLGINELAAALQLPMFSIPPSIDLRLSEASLSYDFDTEALTLSAKSLTYGSVLFMSQQLNGKYQYVFVLDFETSQLSIDTLPLFGDLPTGQRISLDHFQITGASNAMTAEEMTVWNSALPATGEFSLPPSIDAKGASISGTATLGTLLLELFLPLSTTDAPDELLRLKQLTAINQTVSDTSQANAFTPLTIWMNVQSSLGPIYVNRVGFAYQGDQFCIFIDAALEFTSLRLDAIGLGMSATLDNLLNPNFSINGLGLNFQQPPLQISGGLLRTADQEGEMAFDGQATLSMTDLNLSALGAYSTFQGKSSLFVFAILNKAIGGSPYFYVTGLSAGFGYNRALTIPIQSTVQDFPLVAGLSDPSKLGGPNPSPNEALATLVDWTPAIQGQYWFALGVQGTTFEIINTNALFVVQFGRQTLISIIGIATLKQPQSGTPFVYAALNLVANFLPDEGEINLSAALAPGAYVLTRDAKLKGGFAFVSWFGRNIHSGEFVFTMGGYSQYFIPPNYYPVPAALGLDWQIAKGMSFTGTAYFAIVPSVMMAGTDMQFSYHAGALKAWLKVRTDILLFWKPFYFMADVSVSVGVSLRVKTLFVTTTLSGEVGSDFHLWGPTMGGSMRVDWSILAFTIKFGAKKSPPGNNITWEEFSGLLPTKTIASDNNILSAEKSTTTTVYLNITVNQGLMNSKELAGESHWLVNADAFELAVDSAIPASQITVASDNTDNNQVIQGEPVGMCRVEGGIAPENYVCTQTVSVSRVTDPASLLPDANDVRQLSSTDSIVDLTGWEVTTIEKGLPTAMWSNQTNPDPTQQTVIGTTGITMVPKAPEPVGTPIMEIATVFSFTEINEENDQTLSVSPAVVPTPIMQQLGDSFSDIKQITSDPAQAGRDAVYAELTALSMNWITNGSLSGMAANPGGAFVDEPLLGTTA